MPSPPPARVSAPATGAAGASAIAAASAYGRATRRVSIQNPSSACSRVVCRMQRDSLRRIVA